MKKNPFHDYRLLMLDSKIERQALEALITRLEDGELTTFVGSRKGQCQNV